MNQRTLLQIHDMLCREAKSIMAEKNDAYAGSDDLFRNFTAVEKLGIATTEAGILIRMADKFSRLTTFVQEGEAALGKESYRDSILDLINYLCLLHAYICNKRDKRLAVTTCEVVDDTEQDV